MTMGFGVLLAAFLNSQSTLSVASRAFGMSLK
jgi:hypothetical protein